MTLYKRVFSVENVGQVQRNLHRAITLAEQIEREFPGTNTATVVRLRRTLLEFNEGLNRVAKDTAVEADSAIKRWLTRTKSGRPNTGNNPNLRDSIKSAPIRPNKDLATGQVGVANIEILNALVNPRYSEYGPYWRAQEDGTLHQKGRVVYGGFYGAGLGGGPFKPSQSQAGQHPIFVSTRRAQAAFASVGFSGGPGGKGGAGGGRMVIGRELKARHFIRNGANEAEVKWRSELRALELQVERDLAVILRPSFGRSGRRP